MELRQRLRRERFGLTLIAGSLVVIAIACGIVVRAEYDNHDQRIRTQGATAVQLLARFSFDELVAEDGGLIRAAHQSLGALDIAYVAIVGLDGVPIRFLAAADVEVPAAPIHRQATDWIGSRKLPHGIREFFAPSFRDGRIAGYVRIGFLDEAKLFASAMPLLASIALLIFLLVPMGYALLRREMTPVAAATSQMRALVERVHAGEVGTQTSTDAVAELSNFVSSFERFLEGTREKVAAAERTATGTLASSRLSHYQKLRLEAALEALPEGAILFDPDGIALVATSKTETVLGIAPSEIVGAAPERCPLPDTLRELVERYEGSDALARPQTAEWSTTAPNERTVIAKAVPLPRRSEQDPEGLLVLVREKAARSGNVSSEFVGHVAHELKAPLQSVLMYAELLSSEKGEVEEFRIEACNVIHDEVERLSGLISTLLAISRIESGARSLDRQRVKIADLLRDTAGVVQRSPGAAGLHFGLELPEGGPTLYIDKELFRVAVNNLLTNAVKYNTAGGRVHIAIEDGDELAIRISDTGIGIDADQQSHVFEKFFRVEGANDAAGHGLGLALANQIVALHSGRIELRSEKGEGSTFSIVLPKTAALIQEAT